MKNIIIKDERNYQVISGNAITIIDKLPASIYELSYIPDEGFSLNEVNNYFNVSEKLYGQVEIITNRIINTYETVKGNLGVLFSGPKGLGKSLTLRNICKEAVKRGQPIILINKHFDNISSFIDTIQQSIVVVFDEFEKLYLDRNKADKEDLEGQDSLLNLFDSTLAGKKLFLLTCNDINNLSEYLLNRPGRLHYHFRMRRLSIDEINEYCIDNLKNENHQLINDICSLGALVPDFSYDMLRAIIFELNTYNCDLQEARRMLNIETQVKSPFNYIIYFESGETETGFDYIDIVNRHYRLDWYEKADGSRNDVMVNLTKLQWTGNNNGSLILDKKFICQSQKEGNEKTIIEKIIFIPAKEGYLDTSNGWD